MTNLTKNNKHIYIMIFLLLLGLFFLCDRKKEVDELQLSDMETFYEDTQHTPFIPRKIIINTALRNRNVDYISYKFNKYFIQFQNGERYEYKYLTREETEKGVKFTFSKNKHFHDSYSTKPEYDMTHKQYSFYFSRK